MNETIQDRITWKLTVTAMGVFLLALGLDSETLRHMSQGIALSSLLVGLVL
jgi:hypothetical protein